MPDVVVVTFDDDRQVDVWAFGIPEESPDELEIGLVRECRKRYGDTPIIGDFQWGLPVPFVCMGREVKYSGMAILWY